MRNKTTITMDILGEYYPRTDRYEIHFRRYDPSIPGRLVAKPIEFEKVSEGTCVEPCLSLSYGDVQEFMEMFWSMGFRPKGLSGNMLTEKEVERFLDDLRDLILPLPDTSVKED